MDRFDALRVFVTVAETGGFSAAARRLRRSPPSVTRTIAALEQHLGARLLSRTTRVVRLTEAGTCFVADARRLLDELDDAEATAAGSHRGLRGGMRVTASVMFGQRFVAPAVLDFLEQHREVNARLLLADRVVELSEEGIDVAVRIAHLADSFATAVKVGQVRRVVCAAPAYLRRHGRPRHPRELEGHRSVAFHAALGEPNWDFDLEGKRRQHGPQAQLVVNSTEVTLAAALQGRALVRLLSYMAAPHVRAGALELVLEDHEPPALPVHVVLREGRQAAERLRTFVDFLAGRLRQVLAEDGPAGLGEPRKARKPRKPRGRAAAPPKS
ncbi:MAG: LysR family transcriptional regulator [Myxococcales bacterium]|nr:LysR family transcriptional regulator [Myxococcales bacterium]